jgi:hypothetical protein
MTTLHRRLRRTRVECSVIERTKSRRALHSLLNEILAVTAKPIDAVRCAEGFCSESLRSSRPTLMRHSPFAE